MKLYNGKTSFYQWDLNQKVTSLHFKVGDEIHFSNMKQPTALVVIAYELEGKVVADVPNLLLQSSLPITVYRYINEKGLEHTVQQHTFNVTQRAKPDDYVYTETEIFTYKALEERITTLEKNMADFASDIEVALDTAIALCDSYIGGATK